MNQNRFSVGLTGGIGSGKSTITEMFALLGAGIIDTDQIAHALTNVNGPAIQEIINNFGVDFLNANGAMNREKMRTLVFSNASERTRLESILHPMIRIEAMRLARQRSAPYCIFVVPLLTESPTWRKLVTRILVVDCPEYLQIQRVMTRNNLTEQEVQAIMRVQVSREVRLQSANDVIENNDDLDALKPKILRLHQMYVEMARQ